ncbi:hypothetical protein KM043_004693 [Ampulex compressa]|nr:hypothetical protein KM043_004693 [Ampulex compressa]
MKVRATVTCPSVSIHLRGITSTTRLACCESFVQFINGHQSDHLWCALDDRSKSEPKSSLRATYNNHKKQGCRTIIPGT